MKQLILIFLSLFTYQTAAAITCHGTEPFWQAKIISDSFVLDIFGQRKIFSSIVLSAPHGMPNTNEGFVRVYSDARGPVATMISQTCNNGMSDNLYPKEIIIYTENGSLYGCCGEVVQQ